MFSGISTINSGFGVQNIVGGEGVQNNNNGSGTQQNNIRSPRAMDPPGRIRPIYRASSGDDRPSQREDFHIAIICALATEFDAVSLLFDRLWDEDGEVYGRAPGDTNTYTTGRIREHDVALALLPSMGTASAAGAAAGIRSSFPVLKLVLIVGVCGGVPDTGENEVLLGDVVISKTVQHSLGKQYPGTFALKDTVEDTLGRLNRDTRTLVTSFETEMGRRRLRTKAGEYLVALQMAAVSQGYRQSYQYPGVAEDKLFEPDYRHHHRTPQACGICKYESGKTCDQAVQASCADLQCDERHLLRRERLEAKRRMELTDMQRPEIHIGRIRSGDTVMKSGEHRDQIAREHNVIAFEMEGAGAWDEVPCIVVKGTCDYADSHKNNKWQPFAAATAASVAKAFLTRYPRTDRTIPS
ncbi:hypothetical protein PG991_013437 [Apiospora marii]|uniref:Nucleoside phosphorylase domain-containing protein n=1 Tax=Apiospora marii TaxID=335849 RepID=A0ABR1R6W4_9PEZI